MKFHPLTILVISLIASASPAVADSQSAKEMEDLIAGLPYIGASAPVTGTNIEGTSVFANMQPNGPVDYDIGEEYGLPISYSASSTSVEA